MRDGAGLLSVINALCAEQVLVARMGQDWNLYWAFNEVIEHLRGVRSREQSEPPQTREDPRP